MPAKFLVSCFFFLIFPYFLKAEKVGIFLDENMPQVKFAVNDIKASLDAKKYTVEFFSLNDFLKSNIQKKIVLLLSTDSNILSILAKQNVIFPKKMGEQAYAIRTTNSPQKCYWVIGGDAVGAMYGALQMAENIASNSFNGTYNLEESPFMLNRGVKLNLPLDKRVPTYVGGWSSNSAKKAIPHVWDMDFWKEFIDQQARNRYNLLSVWVHHPFPALVKLKDYPKANLPSIEGFDGFIKNMNHEQRAAFWKEVINYAHSRGMKFYFFNWNVYVDYAKDFYPELTKSEVNPATIQYMYKCMYALLETYPELDGFGITTGDGMDSIAEKRTKWSWDAMGSAVKDFLEKNPSRKFNLVHRSVGSNPTLVSKEYASLIALPNAKVDFSYKYAQAHMYSTTTPNWGNILEQGSKVGMKMWLTLRNDDYFYFNWGDTKFAREYMENIPFKKDVESMYIGIDGYNPTRTYFYKDESLNGQLEIKRRWYMEMLWGRISYNPKTSDDVFKNILSNRYPTINAKNLFDAWTLASRALPKVTELIMGKWSLDFHWYPEACWSDPKRCSGFRTIDGFANETTVAKGSKLCDIANSAAGNCNGKKSSYTIANEMQADAEKAISLINELKSNGNKEIDIAITNIKQMAFLGKYYAYKVRGATLKKAGELEKAKDEMAKAYCWWIKYTRLMEQIYHTDSFRNLSINPDWRFGDAPALKEYTDLGGVGIPACNE
jgi:hypothetical protein